MVILSVTEQYLDIQMRQGNINVAVFVVICLHNADKAPVNWDKSNLKSLQTQRMSDFRLFTSTNLSEDGLLTSFFRIEEIMYDLELLWIMYVAVCS